MKTNKILAKQARMQTEKGAGGKGVGGGGEDDGINNCWAGKTSGKRSDG